MAPKKGKKKPGGKQKARIQRRRADSSDSTGSESLLQPPIREPTPPPPREVETDMDTQMDTQVEAESQFESQARVSKRSRAAPLNLTIDQREEVADWFQDHEFLYNTRHVDYRNIEKRERCMREKAAELNCTSKELETWIKSMRDRAGKLTKDSDKSGMEAPKFSNKDQWIISKFGYLSRFMRRVGESKRCRVGQESALRCTTLDPPAAVPPPPPQPAPIRRSPPSAAAGSAQQLLEMPAPYVVEGERDPVPVRRASVASATSVATPPGSSGFATPTSVVSATDISGVSKNISD